MAHNEISACRPHSSYFMQRCLDSDSMENLNPKNYKWGFQHLPVQRKGYQTDYQIF
jgi:hypothetical protein